MKTILISSLFVMCSLLAKAQITLENTYLFSATSAELVSGEHVYYLMDVPLKQCRIYNTSHVLLKTINLTVPEGYYLSDIKYVSRHVFNSDDQIELLYIYEKYVQTTTLYYYQYGMKVVNETGTSLMTLPDGAHAEIKNTGNGNKLLGYTYIWNTLGYYDIVTKVYSLGGTSDIYTYSGVENLMVYPNPAHDYFMINTASVPEDFNGDFSLFSVNGHKVLSFPLEKNQQHAVPVNGLPAGTYIYSIHDRSKLMHSNKIIIR